MNQNQERNLSECTEYRQLADQAEELVDQLLHMPEGSAQRETKMAELGQVRRRQSVIAGVIEGGTSDLKVNDVPMTDEVWGICSRSDSSIVEAESGALLVPADQRKVVIELPDGYSGHTLKFYAEPVETDGGLVKLLCAERGRENEAAWKRAEDVSAAAKQWRVVIGKDTDVQAIQRLLRAILRAFKIAGDTGCEAQIVTDVLREKGLSDINAAMLVESLVERGMLTTRETQAYAVSPSGHAFLNALEEAYASGELPRAPLLLCH